MSGHPTSGPAVDVEQLRGLLEKATPGPWVLTPWNNTGAMPTAWAGEVGEPGDRGPFEYVAAAKRETSELFVALLNAAPALLDLIRRQDAALTAVRELHVEICTDLPGFHCEHCGNRWPCPTIRALASPDTTQEA